MFIKRNRSVYYVILECKIYTNIMNIYKRKTVLAIKDIHTEYNVYYTFYWISWMQKVHSNSKFDLTKTRNDFNYENGE